MPARLLLACLLAAGAAPAAPADVPLAELMLALASVASSRATFVETKHSALLKGPLVLRGTLAYRRPDFLEKHVREPYEERITMQGDTLTLEGATGSRAFTLSAAGAPAVSALVEGMRATRAGDLAALERHFEIALEGSRERWSMTLRPRSEQLARYVRVIAISGAQGRIARIEVHEPGGDRSVMQIREELG